MHNGWDARRQDRTTVTSGEMARRGTNRRIAEYALASPAFETRLGRNVSTSSAADGAPLALEQDLEHEACSAPSRCRGTFRGPRLWNYSARAGCCRRSPRHRCLQLAASLHRPNLRGHLLTLRPSTPGQVRRSRTLPDQTPSSGSRSPRNSATLTRIRLQTVGHLASGIAHDFGNLLAVIVAYAEIAEDVSRDRDRELRRILGEMHAAANRAVHLSSDLLRFSSRTRAKPEPIDIGALITDIKDLLVVSINGRGAVIHQPSRCPCPRCRRTGAS